MISIGFLESKKTGAGTNAPGGSLSHDANGSTPSWAFFKSSGRHAQYSHGALEGILHEPLAQLFLRFESLAFLEIFCNEWVQQQREGSAIRHATLETVPCPAREETQRLPLHDFLERIRLEPSIVYDTPSAEQTNNAFLWLESPSVHAKVPILGHFSSHSPQRQTLL